MKANCLLTTLFILLAAVVAHAAALGTAFEYEGHLSVGGQPATGTYDMRFTLFDAANSGSQVGQPVTIQSVAVQNGLFAATIDFGPGIFMGNAAWLDIAILPTGNVGLFTALSPRQALTPAPNALYAETAGVAASATSASGLNANTVNTTNIQDATITRAKIANGQVVKTINQLHDDVTLAAGKNLTLTVVGNVMTMEASGNGVGAGWQLGGNGGIKPEVDFLGTTDTAPLEFKVNGSRALRLENPLGLVNVIGGSQANFVDPLYGDSTIAGGGTVQYSNHVHAYSATIGGGLGNGIMGNADHATIGGGFLNTIDVSGLEGVIGGGNLNRIQENARNAVIGGGDGNVVATNAQFSVVGGGIQNTNAALESVLGGGFQNAIQNIFNRPSAYSVLGGGVNNVIYPGSRYSTLAGGYLNALGGYGSVIAGGQENATTNQFSTVGGGTKNHARADSAVVAGGSANYADADFSAVGGGTGNLTDRGYSLIGGGNQNVIGGIAAPNSPPHGGAYSALVGGSRNALQSDYSVIGGGQRNEIQPGADNSAIVGGEGNTIQEQTIHSFIGGGDHNTITNRFDPDRLDEGCVIVGGTHNTAAGENSAVVGGSYNLSSGGGSVVVGGGVNKATGSDAFVGAGSDNKASGYDAAVVAGFQNKAIGNGSTVPGGDYNTAEGEGSFAAGFGAYAKHRGSFVWSSFADPGTSTGATSSVPNDFTVKATGGARFFTDENATVGVILQPFNTAWSTLSDRNAKKNFQPVDGREVLAKLENVPVQQWNYKWEKDDSTPHLGPVAQDFKGAFFPGRDDKTITTLEFDGVELAAIKGLNAVMREKEARLNTLEKENAAILERNAALESRLASLEKLVGSLLERKGQQP